MVLINNKNPSDALVIKLILNDLGIYSRIVKDGFAGLNMCIDYKGEIEYAVFDIRNIEIIKHIKRLRHNIQIIGLSPHYDKKVPKIFKRAGFNSLIHKPFSAEQFKSNFYPLPSRESQLKPFLVYNHIPHFTFYLPDQTLDEMTISCCKN